MKNKILLPTNLVSLIRYSAPDPTEVRSIFKVFNLLQ